jgi:hypothetical protein
MFSAALSFKRLFAVALTLVVAGCASAPEAPAPKKESFALKHARYGHTVVADDEAICVVGGSTFAEEVGENGEFRATPLVTAYNFNNEQLNRVADLPDARDTQVFTHDGKLCAVGGYNHKDMFARFDCYNPTSDT